MVVERDEVNLQASGRQCRQPARPAAGVRLRRRAPGRRQPRRPTRCRSARPRSRCGRRSQRDTGEDLEMKVMRRADAGRERTRHRVPQGQDRAREEPRHRGRADRRQRAARASSRASATTRSPPNGAPARARSIRCAAPMPWSPTRARRWARASGAAATCSAIERDGRRLARVDQPRRDPLPDASSMRRAPGRAQIAAPGRRGDPGAGAPLQMIVTEPTAPTLDRGWSPMPTAISR